ncbi:hypothetical protein OIO90_004785 [Microbotryomycetes sp. JL221]|nr:hypothetical protein OIO90_004785 [Microbotryomycetes sp. JL221]
MSPRNRALITSCLATVTNVVLVCSALWAFLYFQRLRHVLDSEAIRGGDPITSAKVAAIVLCVTFALVAATSGVVAFFCWKSDQHMHRLHYGLYVLFSIMSVSILLQIISGIVCWIVKLDAVDFSCAIIDKDCTAGYLKVAWISIPIELINMVTTLAMGYSCWQFYHGFKENEYQNLKNSKSKDSSSDKKPLVSDNNKEHDEEKLKGSLSMNKRYDSVRKGRSKAQRSTSSTAKSTRSESRGPQELADGTAQPLTRRRSQERNGIRIAAAREHQAGRGGAPLHAAREVSPTLRLDKARGPARSEQSESGRRQVERVLS